MSWREVCAQKERAPVGDKTPYALQTKLPKNLADPPHTNRCAIHVIFVLCSTNIEFHVVRLYNLGVRAKRYRSIPIILSICRCLESGQGKIAIHHQNWGSAYGVLSPTGGAHAKSRSRFLQVSVQRSQEEKIDMYAPTNESQPSRSPCPSKETVLPLQPGQMDRPCL